MKLDCVDKIPVDTSSCMKPCSGLIITSFAKSHEYKDLELLYPKIIGQYSIFKRISAHPPGLNGIDIFYIQQNNRYFFICKNL